MTNDELRNLAERIAQNNEEAEAMLAEHFCKCYTKGMFVIAFRYNITSIDDILEIWQETLSALLINLRRGNFKGNSLGSYVFGIYSHQCKEWLKALKREKRGGKATKIPIDDVDNERFMNALQAQANSLFNSSCYHRNPVENLTTKELLLAVKECVRTLPNKEYRKVFTLLLKDYDRQMISEILSIEVERVDNMLCYGKKLLKKCLEQKFF